MKKNTLIAIVNILTLFGCQSLNEKFNSETRKNEKSSGILNFEDIIRTPAPKTLVEETPKDQDRPNPLTARILMEDETKQTTGKPEKRESSTDSPLPPVKRPRISTEPIFLTEKIDLECTIERSGISAEELIYILNFGNFTESERQELLEIARKSKFKDIHSVYATLQTTHLPEREERIMLLKKAIRNKEISANQFMNIFKFGNFAETEIQELLTLAIESGLDIVNMKDDSGQTLLFFAVLQRYFNIVNFLIDGHYADINAGDERGYTVLILAAQNNDFDMVSLLVEKEANIRLKNDFQGKTALQWAACRGYYDIVQLLIEKDPKVVEIKDGYGQTALHLAASGGYYETVQLLIEKDPKIVEIKDDAGRTALHVAAENGHYDIVVKLTEQMSNNWILDKKHYPLRRNPMLYGNPMLLACRDNEGNTPLHLAAHSGNVAITRYLVGQEPKLVKMQNNEGQTPLHMAAFFGKPDMVDILIPVNLMYNTVNLKDEDGQTALHQAVWQEDAVITASLILTAHANANIEDDDGKTPLHIAVENKNLEIVNLLLELPISIDAQDGNGHTALHLAVKGGNKEIVYLLILRGANVNLQDCKGKTPLHLAVKAGNLEIVRFLVSNGAVMNIPDNDGKTLIDYAKKASIKKFQDLIVFTMEIVVAKQNGK